MTKLYPPKLFYCQNPLFTTAENDVLEIRSLFDKAVAESNLINTTLQNQVLLQLYSLYKQATEGDIDVKARAAKVSFEEKEKYDAWASLKGKSMKDAQTEYIMLVNKLKN